MDLDDSIGIMDPFASWLWHLLRVSSHWDVCWSEASSKVGKSHWLSDMCPWHPLWQVLYTEKKTVPKIIHGYQWLCWLSVPWMGSIQVDCLWVKSARSFLNMWLLMEPSKKTHHKVTAGWFFEETTSNIVLWAQALHHHNSAREAWRLTLRSGGTLFYVDGCKFWYLWKGLLGSHGADWLC